MHEIAELATEDIDRCGFTVHANGDWGDYRCELVHEHDGPHAIGLRHHAVPLMDDLSQSLLDARKLSLKRGLEYTYMVGRLTAAEGIKVEQLLDEMDEAVAKI